MKSLNHLSFEEYRAFPAVSQSELKAAYKNPQLFYETYLMEPAAHRRPKQSASPQQQWGSACEAFLRSGQLPDSVVVIPSDVLNKDGHRRGAQWTAFAAEHDGKTLLTQREFDIQFAGLADARQNVRDHRAANAIIYDGSVQWSQRWTWTCPDTELELKAEVDLINVNAGLIVDVKTAADTDSDAFAKSIYNYGYDIQAAQYLDAAEVAFPDRNWTFGWVVIHNQAPYEVEVYEASEQLLAVGRARLLAAKRHYMECLRTGIWRSRTFGVAVTINLPPWVVSKHL